MASFVAAALLAGVLPGKAQAQSLPSPAFKSANYGACDTSQWNSYIGGTQSPMPKCFGSRASSTIDIPFPALNGIGDATGAAVPVNDQRFLQFAQSYVGATTTRDNTHQEIGLAINFLDQTGGGGLPQTYHNQKVALNVFALGIPGGSNLWAMNTDVRANAGFGNYFVAGREADHENANGDYKPGGCPSSGCPAGQINSNYFGDFMTFSGSPITAGSAWTGNANPGSAAMHFGILFQAIGGGNAVGTGLISDDTIYDSTNSATSIRIGGNHTTGLDTTLANTAYAAIFGPGQNQCYGGLQDCLSYDPTGKRLIYVTGSGLAAAISDDGTLAVPKVYAFGTNPLQLGNALHGSALNILDGGPNIVNLVSLSPAPTGFGPSIGASGSDTDIPFNIYSKGKSPVQILTSFTAMNGATFGTVGFNGASAQGRQAAPAALPADGSASNAQLAAAINQLRATGISVGLLQ